MLDRYEFPRANGICGGLETSPLMSSARNISLRPDAARPCLRLRWFRLLMYSAQDARQRKCQATYTTTIRTIAITVKKNSTGTAERWKDTGRSTHHAMGNPPILTRWLSTSPVADATGERGTIDRGHASLLAVRVARARERLTRVGAERLFGTKLPQRAARRAEAAGRAWERHGRVDAV